MCLFFKWVESERVPDSRMTVNSSRARGAWIISVSLRGSHHDTLQSLVLHPVPLLLIFTSMWLSIKRSRERYASFL